MRTLHVDTGKKMHGGQWQALYLMERLDDALLLAPPRSPLFQEARERGIRVRPLSLVSLLRLACHVDVIHAHDARAHTLAALVTRAPVVVSRRVGFPVKESVISRWKYRRVARYLAVSNFVAGRLMEARVPAEKIRVVYDGVPLPAVSMREPGRVVALANKGAEIVRAAAAEARVPIHFTSNLWQDLSTASVFMYISEMEGLGSAALGAMAAGVPVIATRVGGLPEIVEHERTGLLVSDGELPGALRRLLNDPAAAAEMGRRARERVQQQFSLEAMIQGTINVYQEVCRKFRC